MNNSSPFFSIVIPTHNRASMLQAAIRSVLNQTFTNFELCVVDDFSTDDTQMVVKEFNDARIKYMVNDRGRGGAGARNAGIFKAIGQWVAFLDDDDAWLEEKLQLQYDKIRAADEDVGLVYTGFTVIAASLSPAKMNVIPTKKGMLQKALLLENFIGTLSSVCIKRDNLIDIGGLDESLPANQDWDLYIRLAANAKIEFVDQSLVLVHRGHQDRISMNMQGKLMGSRILWDKYAALINSDPRLRYRAASRVFMYAVNALDLKEIWHSVGFTLSGLFYDAKNLKWVLRETMGLLLKRSYYSLRHTTFVKKDDA